ncbi:hypothetical protein Ahy_B03g065811 isoform B [Arachis hypogaea]|uniref:non-specific serine/threonine protein kinase n=1 Tax=Arachis hypogaea TaxID=3818 RepID=A0A445A2F3_ARAHY|nr:hypothetical protein Ahy_B03g065811 isoform B [Arachis hypogaea]
MSNTILVFFFFFFITLQQSYSENNDTSYSICSKPFSCGTRITNASYPFWGGNRPQFCGTNGFKLTCTNNTTSLQIGLQKFHVLAINQTQSTMRLVRTDFVYDRCSSNLTNTSLNGSPFHFLPNTLHNITIFYDCPSGSHYTNNFTCQNDSSKRGFYAVNGTQAQQFRNCGVSVQVQVSGSVGNNLKGALDEGFDVQYDADLSSKCKTCTESGGVCGTNNETDSSQFSCYCPTGTHASACSSHKSFLGTGIGLPLIAVIICRNKAKGIVVDKSNVSVLHKLHVQCFQQQKMLLIKLKATGFLGVPLILVSHCKCFKQTLSMPFIMKLIEYKDPMEQWMIPFLGHIRQSALHAQEQELNFEAHNFS